MAELIEILSGKANLCRTKEPRIRWIGVHIGGDVGCHYR